MSSPNQSNQNSAMNNQNLPKNLSLTTANSNPLHQTTPTLGLFTNSQSLASPNLLGFNKSNFQTFARVGNSQPPLPGLLSPNSTTKKPQPTVRNQPTAAPVTNHPISRSGFADKETINQENEDQSITQPEDNLIESKDELTDSKKNREYGKAMRRLGSCDTVEQFFSLYLHIKRPSQHLPISDLHIFGDSIKPAWEDPENVGGVKWKIRLKKGLANRLWETLIMSLVEGGLEKLIQNDNNSSSSGEDDDQDDQDEGEEGWEKRREICGVVLSIRRDEDILVVWHKTGTPGSCDVKKAKQVKLSLQTVLQLPLNCHLVYKLNVDCLPTNVDLTTIVNNIQQNPYNNNNNHNHHHHNNQHYHHHGQNKHNNYRQQNHTNCHSVPGGGAGNNSDTNNTGFGNHTHSFSAGFGNLGSNNIHTDDDRLVGSSQNTKTL
ncbi:hypothetical protein Pst134EA_025632 [Puccinia striiformis f. sp. tritici]|uniref:hypothetical protein n=1 Tax=Puccinia striiformis f. sp. tritici TaxID=168172 RepID=UPI0020081E27|nr:hypothetical protein Pst134EA_025632 [Puccinia striiformis f. sp. tritici]KAH9451688.1 hypothetical protein Pst134EA_025632 [Puccinia striiformis f. sp. tritici]